EDYLAVLDSLYADLINLGADLQTKRLPFPHRLAVDDGKVAALVDRNTAEEECARRNFALVAVHSAGRNSCRGLEADRPKWTPCCRINVEGGFILDRKRRRFVGGFAFDFFGRRRGLLGWGVLGSDLDRLIIGDQPNRSSERQYAKEIKKIIHRFPITVVAPTVTG